MSAFLTIITWSREFCICQLQSPESRPVQLYSGAGQWRARLEARIGSAN